MVASVGDMVASVGDLVASVGDMVGDAVETGVVGLSVAAGTGGVGHVGEPGEGSDAPHPSIVARIHGTYCLTAAYTPGLPALAQPNPHDTTPTCLSAAASVPLITSGPPLSPWQLSLPGAAAQSMPPRMLPPRAVLHVVRVT